MRRRRRFESRACPYIILRPSIIVGDSKTGEVGVDKMVYGVAKTYYLLTRLLNREYRDRGGIPEALKYYVKGEPGVRYFFAELNGTMLGYIFFNPIYRDDQIIGYYANTERYAVPENLLPGRFNIMTYITYEAAARFM